MYSRHFEFWRMKKSHRLWGCYGAWHAIKTVLLYIFFMAGAVYWSRPNPGDDGAQGDWTAARHNHWCEYSTVQNLQFCAGFEPRTKSAGFGLNPFLSKWTEVQTVLLFFCNNNFSNEILCLNSRDQTDLYPRFFRKSEPGFIAIRTKKKHINTKLSS